MQIPEEIGKLPPHLDQFSAVKLGVPIRPKQDPAIGLPQLCACFLRDFSWNGFALKLTALGKGTFEQRAKPKKFGVDPQKLVRTQAREATPNAPRI